MVARDPLNVTGQENGGAVCWQNTWLLTAVLTSLTPTLSDAVDVTVCVPGASVAPLVGAVIVTLGAVVSVDEPGAAVGAGVGDGGGGGGVLGDPDAVLPDCAALSALKSAPTSVPSEALPLYGLEEDKV